MSRRDLRLTVLSVLLVAPILAVISCDEESNNEARGSGKIEAAEKAAATSASVMADLAASALTAGAVATSGPAGGISPQGEYGLTCPVVTKVPHASVTLDYGSGCVSELDGRNHSGSVTCAVNFLAVPPAATITFSSYGVNDYTVGGTVSGSFIPPGTVSLSLSPFTLDEADTTWSMMGPAVLTVDKHGTPDDIHDDEALVSFEVDVTITTPSAPAGLHPTVATPAAVEEFTLLVSPSHELVFHPGCAWPVSGVLQMISSDSSHKVTTIDFGDGTCDDQALLTLPGGSTSTITLHDP